MKSSIPFYRVWLGRSSFGEAVRAGTVRLEGVPALVRAFPTWFIWSPMANLVRARRAEVSYGDRVGSEQNAEKAHGVTTTYRGGAG